MKKKIFYPILTAILVFLGISPLYSQPSTPIVSKISATATTSSIITVSWTLPTNTKNCYINSLIIYRDSKPIQSFADIEKLEPIAVLPHGMISYNDEITENVEYYYAVVSTTIKGNREETELYYDEQLDPPLTEEKGEVYKIIVPGVNATIEGAKLKSKQKTTSKPKQVVKEETKTYENNELREKPLPFIDIFNDDKQKDSKISKATTDNVSDLTNKKEIEKPYLEPYFFEEDLISPTAGDEYLLYEILRTSFVKKEYEQAEKALKLFLAQNRTPEVLKRAYFYLGECYYFLGDYSKAVNQFVILEEDFPALTSKWIENALDLYQF